MPRSSELLILIMWISQAFILASCQGPPKSEDLATSFPYPLISTVSHLTSGTPRPTDRNWTPTPPLNSITPVEPIHTPLLTAQTETSAPTEIPEGLYFPVDVDSMYFVDEKHGWIAGSISYGVFDKQALALTNNGGLDWQPLPVPMTYQIDRMHVFFRDPQQGWLYFPFSPVDGLLYSTSDSGETWVEQHTDGIVIQMGRSSGGKVWALEQEINGSSIRLLYIDSLLYDDWKEYEITFPSDIHSTPRIEYLENETVWFSMRELLKGDKDRLGEWEYQLMSTTNAGINWLLHELPINRYGESSACAIDASVVDPNNIWFGHGCAWGAGNGDKTIYFSGDRGMSWEIVGSSYTDLEETIPTGGYFWGVEAVDNTFAYLQQSRAPFLVITRDGGNTWIASSYPCVSDLPPDVFFLDGYHGWISSKRPLNNSVCVGRTKDGGDRWGCTLLPGNVSCYPN